MEFKRASNWTDSIAAILRKTEMNLIKIQRGTPEDFSRPGSSFQQFPSYYEYPESRKAPQLDSEETVSTIQKEIGNARTAIEKLINERDKTWKEDLSGLKQRLGHLEQTEDSLRKEWSESYQTFKQAETRVLRECEQLSNQIGGFVTEETLKVTAESLKNTHLHQINQIELELKEVKSFNEDLKEEVHSTVEKRLREHGGVTQEQINSLKSQILAEVQTSIKQSSTDLEAQVRTLSEEKENLQNQIADLKEMLLQRQQTSEEQLRSFKQKLDQFQSETSKEINTLNSNFTKLENAFDTEDLEAEVQEIKKNLNKIPEPQEQPDLGHLATQQEVESLKAQLKSLQEPISSRMDQLEERIRQIEMEESASEEGSLEIEAPKEEQKPEEKGLATFGIEQKQQSRDQFMAISLNDMGESDDESAGFVSPTISPMNQVVGQYGKGKRFNFQDASIIKEEPQEEETLTPENRTPNKSVEMDHFVDSFANEFLREEMDKGLFVIQEVFNRVSKKSSEPPPQRPLEESPSKSFEASQESDSDLDFEEDLPLPA